RHDIEALWENFMISERIKHLHYSDKWVNYWYWRTRDQKEIDFVEESDGKMNAFEFKWNPKAKVQYPKLFLKNYENAQFTVVDQQNFDSILLDRDRMVD